MKLADLLNVAPKPLVSQGRMIAIPKGSYESRFHNRPNRPMFVDRDFYTPETEVTNRQFMLVQKTYSDIKFGVFIRDTATGPTEGFEYLFAAGPDKTNLVSIDKIGGGTHVLPPALGIQPGQSLEDFVKSPGNTIGTRFEILHTNVRHLFPSLGFLLSFRRSQDVANPDAAMTGIQYHSAQAIAQFMGGRGLSEVLFELSGHYYFDLPTEAQWGRIAMEGDHYYMTKTGDTLFENGKLKACYESLIPANQPNTNEFAPLPNGVRPNTAENFTKNPQLGFLERIITRGGSFNLPGDYRQASGLVRSASKSAASSSIGMRVVAVPVG